MKCPYCAEDVRDEAIACKHCHREFAAFLPILRQLAELNKKVDALALVTQTSLSTSVVNTQPDRFGPLHVVIIACGGILSAGLIALVAYEIQSQSDPMVWAVLGGSFVPPLLTGFAVRWCWNGGTLAAYFATGLLLGVVQVSTAALATSLNPGYRIDLSLASPFFLIGDALLVVTGSLVADVIVRRRSPTPTSSVIERLARSLVPTASNDSAALARAEKLVSIAGPVLSFIASMFTAYLGYLATKK